MSYDSSADAVTQNIDSGTETITRHKILNHDLLKINSNQALQIAETNTHSSQSIAKINSIPSDGSPTADITISRVTKPA